MSWKVPVAIKRSTDIGWMIFDDLKSCAEYIAIIQNTPYSSVRWKLTKRRHNIFGFDIKYL